MFSTEVFIEKMVASYLSSSKNKKVSDVQKESLSQIMKSFILQMNPFITPNEADRAIEYGVLKSRGSGVMVSLKTDYEKEKTDGIRRPIIIITVNKGNSEKHFFELYYSGKMKLSSEVKGMGFFAGRDKDNGNNFNVNFYNPNSIEYINKVGNDVVLPDDNYSIDYPGNKVSGRGNLTVFGEFMKFVKRKTMSVRKQTENVDDFNAAFRRR